MIKNFLFYLIIFILINSPIWSQEATQESLNDPLAKLVEKIEETDPNEKQLEEKTCMCTLQIETPNGAYFSNNREKPQSEFVLDQVFKSYQAYIRYDDLKSNQFMVLNNAKDRYQFILNDNYTISSSLIHKGRLDENKYLLYALAFEDLKNNFHSLENRIEIYQWLRTQGNLTEDDIREFSNLIGNEYLYNDEVRSLIVKHYQRDVNDIWQSMQLDSEFLSGDCFHDAIRHYETLTQMGIEEDRVWILFNSKSSAFHTVALFKGEDNRLNVLSYEHHSNRAAGINSTTHQTRINPAINSKVFVKIDGKFVLKGSKDLPKGSFFKELTGEQGAFIDPNQVLFGRMNKVEYAYKKGTYAAFSGTTADGQKIVGLMGQHKIGKNSQISYIPHYSTYSNLNVEGKQYGFYTSISTKFFDKTFYQTDKLKISFDSKARLQVFATGINEEITYTFANFEEIKYQNDGLSIDFAGQIPLTLQARLNGKKTLTTFGLEYELTPSLNNMSKFMKFSSYITLPAINSSTIFANLKTKDNRFEIGAEYFTFNTFNENILHINSQYSLPFKKQGQLIIGSDYYRNLEFDATAVGANITLQCQVNDVQVDVKYNRVFNSEDNPIQITTPHTFGVCIKRSK